jgi:hypothetical protein
LARTQLVPILGAEVHMHMKKLTWRDAASTALVVAGLAMALSIVMGWGWPLLGGTRAGIIVLGAAGLASCVLGSSMDRFYFTDPFGVLTTVVAMVAMAVGIIGGLIFGTLEYLYALMAVVAMLWALATLRHAIEGSGTAPLRKVAG